MTKYVLCVGLLLVFGFFWASHSAAEVVQITVPALAADYPFTTPQGVPCRPTGAFDYPGEEVGVVQEVRVHLQGTVWPGLGEDCNGTEMNLGAGLGPWLINDSAADAWRSTVGVAGGPFELDLTLPNGNPDFQDPIRPGDVLYFRMCFVTESACVVVQEASAQLTEVTFTVTTASIVPTENSTWGRIKALYK
jgi:hypothetical protein